VAVEGVEESAPVLGGGIEVHAAGVEEVGVEVEEAVDRVIILAHNSSPSQSNLVVSREDEHEKS
jgi:hypothetical protein